MAITICGREPKKVSVIPRFMKAIDERSERRVGLHVSALSYDCNRRIFYFEKYKNPSRKISDRTVIRFWIGRKLHETPILGGHELELDLDGVVMGQPDEYDEPNGILVEKKTCRKIPFKPQDHYVKQVEYYALMLRRSGKPVNTAFILYIDVNNNEVAEFRIHLRPYKLIESELMEKVRVVTESLKTDTPPPVVESWLCDYCPFFQKCFPDAEPFDYDEFMFNSD